jgi:hypothetical protein
MAQGAALISNGGGGFTMRFQCGGGSPVVSVGQMAIKEDEEALMDFTDEQNGADDDLQGECGSQLLAPKKEELMGNMGAGSARGRE